MVTAGGGPAVAYPGHVTAAWLTGVLRSSGALAAGAVTSFEAEPVGTGQMADCVRFRLAYDGRAAAAGAGRPPDSVIGKFTAADPTSRATGLAMRTSEVEVRFYQQVAGTVAVRTPRCHHAEVDPSTAEFVLVLEDLAPARPGDQLAGCTVDEAAAALEELARLHAPRWADPRLRDLDWLDRRTPGSEAVTAELLAGLFAAFLDRYGSDLDPVVVEVGTALAPRLAAYLRRRPGPETVQHADFRLDNLLFGEEEGRRTVTVVDWQTVTVGPGAADASYFVGGGLRVDDRRRAEVDLLRGYHRALCAGGVEGYGWERCWADYRLHAFAGFLMAVGASMMVERTERGDAMFLTMASRHAAQIRDLDSMALLDG